MLCCGGPGGGRCLGGGFLHGDWLLERTGTRFHWVSPPMGALRAPRCRGARLSANPGVIPLKALQKHAAPRADSHIPSWGTGLALGTGARLYRELGGAGEVLARCLSPPARPRRAREGDALRRPGAGVGGLPSLDPEWKTLNKKAVWVPGSARPARSAGAMPPPGPMKKRRASWRKRAVLQGRSRNRVRPGTGPGPAPGCRAAVRCR